MSLYVAIKVGARSIRWAKERSFKLFHIVNLVHKLDVMREYRNDEQKLPHYTGYVVPHHRHPGCVEIYLDGGAVPEGECMMVVRSHRLYKNDPTVSALFREPRYPTEPLTYGSFREWARRNK